MFISLITLMTDISNLFLTLVIQFLYPVDLDSSYGLISTWQPTSFLIHLDI